MFIQQFYIMPKTRNEFVTIYLGNYTLKWPRVCNFKIVDVIVLLTPLWTIKSQSETIILQYFRHTKYLKTHTLNSTAELFHKVIEIHSCTQTTEFSLYQWNQRNWLLLFSSYKLSCHDCHEVWKHFEPSYRRLCFTFFILSFGNWFFVSSLW